MKSGVLYTFAVLVLTILSCTKKDSIENVGIVGKWQLKEIFSGYANGGSFVWNNVSIDESYILTFAENGQYNKKENVNGDNRECIGTYSLQNTNNLEINSNCSTTTENMFVSELTNNSLIIDHSVIEGKIRYKYTFLSK